MSLQPLAALASAFLDDDAVLLARGARRPVILSLACAVATLVFVPLIACPPGEAPNWSLLIGVPVFMTACTALFVIHPVALFGLLKDRRVVFIKRDRLIYRPLFWRQGGFALHRAAIRGTLAQGPITVEVWLPAGKMKTITISGLDVSSQGLADDIRQFAAGEGEFAVR